ncbi:MAG: hypothetical protein HOQ11_06970 [Gemmatimonadaceae bacterium]|nr:hypothetical protein [Gemmatimonadaceae bacterium]NUQ94008.1 hypothetical protein [Gemmatimonadaceae bacterium]NUR34004.1 hypothetical protein [Gemmatimonadaceae bacterium]NUS97132.1 hypothetical protein [Gemmatimonadaceae bacterium]
MSPRHLPRDSLPKRLGPWLALAAAAATLLGQIAGLVKLVHEMVRGW